MVKFISNCIFRKRNNKHARPKDYSIPKTYNMKKAKINYEYTISALQSTATTIRTKSCTTKMAQRNEVLSLRFNQDQGLFAACMTTGIRIYAAHPLRQKLRLDVENVGSVKIVEMVYHTNIFGIVSGGPRPKYPDNILAIYDAQEKSFKMEITFTSSILGLKMRKDKIVIAQLTEIHVFTWPTPTQKLFTINTRPNPRGLLDLSPLMSSENQVIVFPGHKSGSVQVVDLVQTEHSSSSAPHCIPAHKADLAVIKLNQQGTRLATCSVNGTLIRVWDTAAKTQLVELRRGTDPAIINCINFSQDSEYLCCSSDKGTVHIFAIKNTGLNRRMALQNLGILGNYGESQWALAHFTIPAEKPCICGFNVNNSVIACGFDGGYHKYIFNNDGNCNRECYDMYLNVCDEEDFFF